MVHASRPLAEYPPDEPAVDPRLVFDRLRAHLSPRLALTGKFAGGGAVEVSASGSRVRLSDGRSVLDFGSYAVALLGHRHPDVVAAAHRQLDLMPAATRSLANPVAAEAAEALSSYLGGALPKVYFGLNGSDAVEVAVKLARLAAGRDRVLAVKGGYHGKTLGALSLTDSPFFRAGLRGARVDVVHVSPDDPGAVAAEIARGDVAAVIFEPVQGENGVIPLPLPVLRRWAADTRRHGAFFIADEIQCGLRRCGERSVALAQRLPVDAVLVGKPLGGGVVPLSAVACSPELYAPLAADPFLHSATFGGHPLSCAVLPAALGAIEELAEHGRSLAAGLEAGLARLRERHGAVVTACRGRGLLWGIDFITGRAAGEVVMSLANAGLLVSPCLSRPTTVRLLPPLTTTHAELDEGLAILDEALRAASDAVLSTSPLPAPPADPSGGQSVMRILLTGATGVIGSEAAGRLRALPGARVTATARRAPVDGPGGNTGGNTVAWHIGHGPPPPPLDGPWDVIVHTAACTRWTMSRPEALDANVGVLRAVLGLAGPGTHLVHLSTAYVGGQRNRSDLRGEEFEGYRNGYEWSKAACERMILDEHRGPVTIVRPPLVVGRRADGRIARFTGPYTIFSALVSGLGAVVIGDPDGYTEISPVDDVADVVAAAVVAGPPAEPRTEVIAGGRQSLRLSEMIGITCRIVNEFRAEHGVAPISVPPTVSIESWDRFYLPLSRQWLSPTQRRLLDLLGMFYSYTSMTVPFEPTYPVRDAASVLATAVRHWAGSNPSQALAAPKPWRRPAAP